MDVGRLDCEIEDNMLQEGGSAAEGDYDMRGELVGDGSAHLPEALDHELRHGDLIFQREDTSTRRPVANLLDSTQRGEGWSRGQDSMKGNVIVRRISHWGSVPGESGGRGSKG